MDVDIIESLDTNTICFDTVEKLESLSSQSLRKLITSTQLSEDLLKALIKNNDSKGLLDLIVEHQTFSESFLRNELVPLNISFILLGHNSHVQLSNSFLNDFSHEIGNALRPYLLHNQFSEEFLQDFIISPDTDCILLEMYEDLNAVILKTQTLSVSFLEKMNEAVHFDRHEYSIISQFQHLSEEFMLKHLWNLNIHSLSLHQPLTLKIVHEIYNSTDLYLLDYSEFNEYIDAQENLFQNLTKNKYIPSHWFFDTKSYQYLKPHWNSHYHHISHLRRFQRLAKKRIVKNQVNQ